jgi:beta-mannosidase
MKKKTVISFLSLTLSFCFSTHLMAQKPYTISLNKDWTIKPVTLLSALKPSDLGQNISQNSYTTQLPTTVVGTLEQNKVLENPYLPENTRGLAWLEKTDWTFECRFDVDDKVLDAEKTELILRGVDTYSSVFLNDVLLYKTDNVFQTWSAEVINLLQAKNNRLRISFISPYNKNKEFGEAFEFDDSQTSVNKLSELDALSEETLEKRIVSMGIEGIELTVWSRLKLNDVFIKQNRISAERADLEAQTVVSVTQPSKINVKISCGTTVVMKDTFLKAGVHHLDMPFVILKPQLWWTKNLGKPFLYAVQTVVSNNQGQSDMLKSSVGLRNITLLKTQKGKDETISLQINGRDIKPEQTSFDAIKATNELIKQGKWDALIEKVSASRNALIYLPATISRLPPTRFYELCDEQGILVWQDFVLSNMVYMNTLFVEKQLEKEADKQVSRLRSFACIGVWNGNIEPFKVFGQIVPPDNRLHTVSNQPLYAQLFQTTLPEMVSKYNNQTIYDPRLKWNRAATEEGLNTNLSQGQETSKQEVAVVSKSVSEFHKPIEDMAISTKTPVALMDNTESVFEDVILSSKVENDTFKLTARNDRLVTAKGDFFVHVYDPKGKLLFTDWRVMSVESKRSLAFYRYDLKTLLQGESLSNVVIVATWQDAANPPFELKKSFSFDSKKMSMSE